MSTLPSSFSFLASDSEVASLIGKKEWCRTPLGSIKHWPSCLKQSLAIILRSAMPMVLLWGKEGILLYNDAYAAFVGSRHPSILGLSVQQAWPEVADFNLHIQDQVLSGHTLSFRDQHMILELNGVDQDVWLNLDYSPIPDEEGNPIGILAVLKDTTSRIHVEQRLRVAQEAGGIGLFEWYPDSGLLEVSDEYRKIWALPPEVSVTDSLLVELLHPDDRQEAGPAKLSRVNPLEYTEYRRIDPETGNVHWLARKGEVISSPTSKQQRFVGAVMDITDRKRNEAALAASETRWRDLFEQMQEGFFIGEAIRDEEGRMVDFHFIEVNPAFETLTGLSSAAVARQTACTAIPDIEPELLDIYATVANGTAVHFETFVSVRGGRWFEARARPLGADRFTVLFLDITERKLATKRIAESEERFRTLAQTMPNHVWTAQPDGSLNWLNERIFSYAGPEFKDLTGEFWINIVHPDDVNSAQDAWMEAIQQGSFYAIEFRLRRHDGQYRWHITRAAPVRDASGAINQWVGTNTDIHDQKIAEEALTDFAATLEERVLARTEELNTAQAALRHVQKIEAIGNLTGGIAHDFNNLLQVISGNLQLLAKEMTGQETASKQLENAMEGVSRGAKLAAQLLAFGRRQPLAPKVINLNRLLRDMDEILRRTLGEAVEIETIITGGLWNTLIDRGNLENAILNMAINARDAMNGRGKLTIEAGNAFLDADYARSHAEVVAGQYVLLAISDTGTGMSPEIIDNAFDPFFTTKPEGRGTGLGLSMVYGFVKQSGGHIKIYSEIDHGTTIKIYLPRSAQSEDTLVQIDAGPVVGGNEVILLAEDDDAVREIVTAMLGDLGYRVLIARDAHSALAIIESGISIDLLFTDVVMPGPLKSAEMGRKARERLPTLAVLFTSGYTENSIVHGGKLDEGVEFLSKPYTREALARKLRHVLANCRNETNPNLQSSPELVSEENDRLSNYQRRNILVCEDDVLIRMSVVDMLGDMGHCSIEASDALTVLEILSTKQTIDLVITDIGLSGMSGIELANKLEVKYPKLPVIFATGHNDVPGIVLSKKRQLLVKPFSEQALAAAIMEATSDCELESDNSQSQPT